MPPEQCGVIIRQETVTIPTYPVDRPNTNPMFLEKRVYQGSSGVVYPHPIVERVSDEKVNQDYHAVFLENRYLEIMLLPEIGGRVQMALDKTNGYYFVYYNHVIKPALVGLTGPWISGGIEFNWPQHHRPSTFDPVDVHIQEHPDGSKTIWMSEIERMFRTKGMAGFTLYPDRAYLEVRVQLYNRTSEPQTFLWWANPAVHVSDAYQSVFPPDVYAVMDHGKRDVSAFPIATGTYYKVDYSPGTDISRYKNIPVPTSYMAYRSDFDFIGSYDHDLQAGMLHVANHHVVPGKKQWTWGNGDFGQAWDRQLTDADGPYVELMCGAYTDNQPDFSWLGPGEEKCFTQFFMPYKAIGPAKNANQEAAVSLEVEGGQCRLGVYVTRPSPVRIRLHRSGELLLDQLAELDPTKAFVRKVDIPRDTPPHQLGLQVLDAQNDERELITYAPPPPEQPKIPAPATAALPPEKIASNEELFLNGLHLEQYRHATYAPEPYYQEALRRDPFDSRCNNALGLLLLRRGKFVEAEPYFRNAIKRLTLRNPNPYDGEPHYNLGLSLKLQGRYDEAFDAFYKAVWTAAWQNAGYFELARLASRAGRYQEALDLVDRSLVCNWHHHQAHHLKIALLRHLGQETAALALTDNALELDGLDFGVLYERYLLARDTSYRDYMRGYVHNYVEIALDYTHAGLLNEAIALLEEAPLTDPMVKYYQGWCYLQTEDAASAKSCFEQARALPPDYCFPHRIEAVLALEAALKIYPSDARAPYYLGNFWYARRRYEEAITSWEQARARAPRFPTTHRNLGLAYMNKRQDPEAALAAYENAFALDPSDARVFFELDQLYKKQGEPPQRRLARLEAYEGLVEERYDLLIEKTTLLNVLGRHREALELLLTRRFHPWEGGEGKVTAQYVVSLVELAKRHLNAGQFTEAFECLERARTYPDNLGEGKLAGAQENHIDYYLGCVHENLGQVSAARKAFQLATIGLSEPTSAKYYNDQPPDMIFYQGLARAKLGDHQGAQLVFQKLVDYGHSHLDDDISIDYFAVSLPSFLVFDEDLSRRNRIHCHYMMALGYLGLEAHEQAAREFGAVLGLEPHHLGATIHRRMLRAEEGN